MMILLLILLGLDIYWHIWEYKERKRLDKCWEDLFNSKLESEKRWETLFKKIIKNKDE